jgi:hypothetical protein
MRTQNRHGGREIEMGKITRIRHGTGLTQEEWGKVKGVDK